MILQNRRLIEYLSYEQLIISPQAPLAAKMNLQCHVVVKKPQFNKHLDLDVSGLQPDELLNQVSIVFCPGEGGGERAPI